MKLTMKENITFWYKHGIWTLTMVRNAVEKKVINAEDYEEITGNVYSKKEE